MWTKTSAFEASNNTGAKFNNNAGHGHFQVQTLVDFGYYTLMFACIITSQVQWMRSVAKVVFINFLDNISY
jgi:hypothetical protein